MPRSRAQKQRETLTREQVVRAGLALLEREGAEGLSTRRLAAALGVTPMALYNHVRDKPDLLRAIAASVVEGVVYPPPSADWRESIRSSFRALRAACLRHPRAVPLIESAEVLPASVFEPMERTLAALAAAGLPAADATRAYYLLITFTLGQVSYQARGWERGVDAVDAVERARIAPSRFPNVTRAAAVRGWDWDASFDFGLQCILDGIAAALPRSARSDRPRRARTARVRPGEARK